MVLSTNLIKLKFPALALLEASAIETLYSGQFTSPTRLGKKSEHTIELLIVS